MMNDFHKKMMETGIPLDILAEFLEITPKQMENYCYGEAEPPPELMAKASVLPLAAVIVKTVAARNTARKAAMAQAAKNLAAQPVRLNPRFTGDLRIETERKRQTAKKGGKNRHAGR